MGFLSLRRILLAPDLERGIFDARLTIEVAPGGTTMHLSTVSLVCYATRLDSNENRRQDLPPVWLRTEGTAAPRNMVMARSQKR